MTVTRGNKHANSYVITTAAKRTLLPVTITQETSRRTATRSP
ncbi:hypothetical protein [Bifidobacterium longum]|nr:hypothetical protein [Bifidobacterium longum]